MIRVRSWRLESQGSTYACTVANLDGLDNMEQFFSHLATHANSRASGVEVVDVPGEENSRERCRKVRSNTSETNVDSLLWYFGKRECLLDGFLPICQLRSKSRFPLRSGLTTSLLIPAIMSVSCSGSGV